MGRYFLRMKNGVAVGSMAGSDTYDPAAGRADVLEVSESDYELFRARQDSHELAQVGGKWTTRTRLDPLPVLQAAAIRRLETDTRTFIENRPNGEPRYTQQKQSSLNAIWLACSMMATDKDTTDALREQSQKKMKRLLGVQQWVSAVLAYHYQVLNEIKACETREALALITWDYSDLDEIDPDVRLEEVRI